MKVIVDADACPVKDIIINETKNKHPVVLVSSMDHFSNAIQESHVNTIYVDKGVDSADFKIVQIAQKGDLVITQDYGLASLLIGKGIIVIHHNSYEFTSHNIDMLLAKRHMNLQIRNSGGRHKGPKAFSNDDKNKFNQFINQYI